MKIKFHLPVVLILVIAIQSCRQSEPVSRDLLLRMDSLEKKLANTYTPGLGEFMSSIQAHHSKLWFAGQNQNWKLADFEVHELMETVDNIKKIETNRKEIRLIEMINPPLDSINSAIKNHDQPHFKISFSSLTQTCNTCHQATDFGFNKVIIPGTSPFSNQEFRTDDKKRSD